MNRYDDRVYEDRVVRDDRSGVGGFLVGLAVLIILAILLFAFGIPALRRSSVRTNTISPSLNINPGASTGTGTGTGAGGTNAGGNTTGGTGTGATQ